MKQFWHLVGQTVKLSVSAMFHVWLQTILQAFFRSFEWKWLAKQRGQSVTIHFSQSGLWSSKLPRSPEMIGAVKASPFQWCEVRRGRMWWCCQWPPPAPRAWPCDHLISRLSAPDVSQAELLLAFSPSRGETNHPLFLSIFRDFDD